MTLIKVSISAVAIGAVTQIRTLGGAVGLGIATGVLNNYIKTHLAPILTAEQLAAYLQTTEVTATFPVVLRDQVRIVLGQGYTLQMKMLLGKSRSPRAISIMGMIHELR